MVQDTANRVKLENNYNQFSSLSVLTSLGKTITLLDVLDRYNIIKTLLS